MTSIVNLFDGSIRDNRLLIPVNESVYDNETEIQRRIELALDFKIFSRDVLGDAYIEDEKRTTVLRSVFKVGIAPSRTKQFTPPYTPTGTPEEKKKLYFEKIFLNITKSIYENSSELGFKMTFSSPTLKDLEYDKAVTKDYFLIIGSGIAAFIILFTKTLYILTSLSVLLQCLATHLATYMLFIARFGVENLSMLHILSFFYVVSASTNQFFHQYATWQIVTLLDLEPKDKMVTFMKTGASTMFFIMLARLAAFLPMIILPYGILKSLTVLNSMSIVLIFLLGLFYITPTLLLNIMYMADKVIFCCKLTNVKCLRSKPLAKIFANVFFKIISKQNAAFSLVVMSIILMCGGCATFITFEFKEVTASQVLLN